MVGLRANVRVALRDLHLDVDLELPPGGRLALAGPSGAGKTTVLRAIAGLRRPDSGRVECGGQVWLDTRAGVDVAPERRRCGFLFQEYALFPRMSAVDNVAYAIAGTPRRERRASARELLARFGLERHADARPRDLSGGERQRVALARALASRPRALLLDEPLSALDPRSRAAAGRELAGLLADAGVPALVVTHDFGEAAMLADEVALLDGGRIVQRDSPARLAAAPASSFVAGFTGAVTLTGQARPGPGGLAAIALDGGGAAVSAEAASGPVVVSIFPWEISLEPAGSAPAGSARNHLPATVVSVTEVGNRVRVGLATPQLLTAEITAPAARELSLTPGAHVVATWKATATRVVPR